MNSAITDIVKVIDHPSRFLSFPDLEECTEGTREGVDFEENGAIITEVGKRVTKTAGGNKYSFYLSRPEKKTKNPSHLFGKAFIGDTYSRWEWKSVALPGVDDTITIEPSMSAAQSALLNIYSYMRCDAAYLLMVDEPLGSNHLLEVSGVDMNKGNIIRNIKWKPTILPVLPIYVPWLDIYKSRPVKDAHVESDNSMGSLSIKIRTLESNSLGNVSQPIRLSFYRCITNVCAFDFDTPGYVTMPAALKPADNIIEVPATTTHKEVGYTTTLSDVISTPPRVQSVSLLSGVRMSIQEQSDTAVAADPVTGADAAPTSGAETTMAPEQPSKIGATQKKLGGKKGRPATKRPEQAKQAVRWVPFMSYSYKNTDLGTSGLVTFEPSSLQKAGENIMKPFRRNVWFTGSYEMGYLTGYQFKVVSTRAPQVAGRIAISLAAGQSYIHKLGGTATEFSAPFDVFAASLTGEAGRKRMNSPWLSTKDAATRSVSFTLTPVSFNSTDDALTMSVRIFVKPMNLTFQVPNKPRAPVSKVTTEEILTSGALLRYAKEYRENNCPMVIRAQADDDEQLMMPGAESYEHGEVDDYGQEETINVDDAWTCVAALDLPTDGSVTNITLDMPKLLDKLGAGGDSAITEKFQRYSTFSPTGESDFGPAIGQYRIVVHPPTGFACNLAHVCLPADVAEETALKFFGLDDILSVAGSALSSIGGPLISGAINTVTDLIGGGVSGLLGGGTSAEESNDTASTDSSPPSIGGMIPITRFLDLLRPASGSDGKNNNADQFANLLIQLLDVFATGAVGLKADAPSTIPVRIFAKMNCVKVENELYERHDVPEVIDNATSLHSFYMSHEQCLRFIEECAHLSTEKSLLLGAKMMKRLDQNGLGLHDYSTLHFDPPPTQEEFVSLLRRFSATR